MFFVITVEEGVASMGTVKFPVVTGNLRRSERQLHHLLSDPINLVPARKKTMHKFFFRCILLILLGSDSFFVPGLTKGPWPKQR